jgi:hypothetical protein
MQDVETTRKQGVRQQRQAPRLPLHYLLSAAASYMYMNMNIYSVRERLAADDSYYLPK